MLEQRQLLSAAILDVVQGGGTGHTAATTAAAALPGAGTLNPGAGTGLDVTATVVTSSVVGDASVYGDAITLTATVTGTGLGAPTGTVTFLNGLVILGTGTLGSNGGLTGTATLEVLSLGAGTNAITARYEADNDNAQSTSSVLLETVARKGIQLTGITVANKVYDGSAAAPIDATRAGLAGVLAADSQQCVIDATAVTGMFATKNVGNAIGVTLATITLTGTAAANYTLQLPNLSANITVKSLTVTGITAADKVYNGSAAATLSANHRALTGVVPGEEANVQLVARRLTGAFGSADAGSDLAVAVTGLSLKGTGIGNYQLMAPVVTATILPKMIVVWGIRAGNKVYDGTTSVAPDATGLTLSYVLRSDRAGVAVDMTNATGTLASADVHKNTAVVFGGLSLTGSAAGNYFFRVHAASASVTARAITVTGITASDKVYDGTTAATLDTSTPALAGVVGGDLGNLSLITANAAGLFASKNAGAGVAVAVSGLALDGTAKGNYTLLQPTTTANITARALTVAGIAAADKTYDGVTSAVLNTTGGKLAGVLSSDRSAVKLITAGATGDFAAANADTGVGVTIHGLMLVGKAATNYVIGQATAMADIHARGVTVTGITATSREYDGTTDAVIDLSGSGLAGVLIADLLDVGLDSSNADASFAVKNVGVAKTATIHGLALTGNAAANYLIVAPTATANVTARVLTFSGIPAFNKAYDGSTVATLDVSNGGVSGLVVDDEVTFGMGGIAGAFSGKDVGEGLVVTISGITIGGADGANYTLDPITVQADITPRAVLITGVTAGDKVFDGDVITTINLSHAVINGILASDIAHVTLDASNAFGAFAAPTVGTGLTVTAGGLLLTGAAAGNYSIAPVTAVADITGQMTATLAGVAVQNKTYDGTNVAVADFTNAYLTGVPQQFEHSVDFSNAVASFNSVNVGAEVAFTISGIVLTDGIAQGYTLMTPAGTAVISQKNVTATGITVAPQVFNGDPSPPLDTSAAVLSGVLLADTQDVILNTQDAYGLYVSYLGGQLYEVALFGMTISGDAAGNYALSVPSTSGLLFFV